MKKKILLLSGVLLTFSIIITILFTNNDKNIQSNIAENNTNVINNDMLTLMYETGIDTNEYEISTSNTWPDDNYIFNKELSGCENGGELSWNQQTNKITLFNNTSDRCYIYFDVYNKAVINNVTSSVTTNSITVNVSTIVGENPISKYYYSINDGEYIESAYNSYTFSNLDIKTIYNIKIYIEDTLGIKSNTYSINIETDDTILLTEYIKNLYTIDGDNDLYYHDGQGNYNNSNQEARDNSYRYAGANPNNYVCFGSDLSTCPSDNLYRIIGVFENEVKLIKWDYVNNNILGTNGQYYSRVYNSDDYSNYNGNHETVNIYVWPYDVWSENELNTVNLNRNYFNNFDLSWQTKIANHAWYVGEMNINNVYTTYTTYDYYLNEFGSGLLYDSKIGLMYISDYGYSASPNYWTIELYNYDVAIKDNWMYMGMPEWTISLTKNSSQNFSFPFYINTSGIVSRNTSEPALSTVRPCFYLNSSVQYVSGSGTQSDPIRIN